MTRIGFDKLYRIARSEGRDRRSAVRQAFVESVIEVDEVQREGGMDYTRQHVRQAIVHSRQDIVLIVAHLAEIGGLLGSLRRWLIVAVLLMAALLLHALV